MITAVEILGFVAFCFLLGFAIAGIVFWFLKKSGEIQ